MSGSTTKPNTFLNMFSCCCSAKTIENITHDFEAAKKILIEVAGKTEAEAQLTINLINKQVPILIAWLQAAQPIMQTTDPALAASIPEAINILKMISLIASTSEQLAVQVSDAQLPTNVKDLGTSIAKVQKSIATFEAFFTSFSALGINLGIKQEDLNKVTTTITAINTHLAVAATLDQVAQNVVNSAATTNTMSIT